MFQRRKDKGLAQTSNLAVQISNLDNKHSYLPWQTWDLLPPAIKEPQSDKCKMVMMMIFHIIVVNATFSA